MAKRKKINQLATVSPHPSESKVILELIQYDDKDYIKFSDLPVEELILGLKSGYVNWINLDGLHDHSIISKLGEHFCLHSLLLEDITSEHQPKAEEYEDYLFFTLKMLYKIKEGEIEYEQISFVLGKDYLLSFQEKEGDPFTSFRDRIRMDHPPPTGGQDGPVRQRVPIE